jgi:hypothetical protein
MAILAIFYLRRRFLTPWRYFAWGFFAILVPLIGPFLVIAIRPGVRKLDKHDKAELTIEQREN